MRVDWSASRYAEGLQDLKLKVNRLTLVHLTKKSETENSSKLYVSNNVSFKISEFIKNITKAPADHLKYFTIII